MPDVPKIVRDRLRADLPEGAHPGPDALTAFAEQMLAAAEREGVLQHLARCADCREVVALSTPPLEIGSQPVTAPENESSVPVPSRARAKAGGWQRPWFAWPAWRWAALAAGVVVAGGILLMRPGKPNEVPEANQQPASTVTQPGETLVAKQSAPSSQSPTNLIHAEKKAAPAERALSRDKESKLAYSAAAPAKDALTRGQVEIPEANKAGAVGAAVASPAPLPPGHSSETVEVTAASGQITTEAGRIDLPMAGRNASDLATISKAKAAKTESNASSSLQRSESLDQKQVTKDAFARQQGASAEMNTIAANAGSEANKSDSQQPAQHPAQWTIHGNELQRSLDSGGARKTVLHSDRPLLCYAAGGNDIWVGGKAGDLFHSANGGVSWNQVHPSAQEQTLVDDVTHIDVYSPTQISLFTSNHQSWSTTDGGKTWEKK
jgi:hypothetical protein